MILRLSSLLIILWAGQKLARSSDTSIPVVDSLTENENIIDDVQTFAENVIDTVKEATGNDEYWRAPQKYRSAIVQAEQENGIPSGLLERLLYQESRYRNDIISGKVKSRVGAMGIAQFMPVTASELGVDPLDAYQSIFGAARYLSRLFKSTGSWNKALAAYNWGIGNVARKGIDNLPAETAHYVSSITNDVAT